MTVGIYALYWMDVDLFYIGKSENIEKRFNEHMYSLLNHTHTNYKVQEANNNFGPPKFIIIEKTSIKELNDKEIFWTNEFNSLNSKVGLNIVEPGGGYPQGLFRYLSKLEVLLIFRKLSSDKISSSSIKNHKISKDSVNLIRSGKTHLWLREKYPFRYRLMNERNPIENYSLGKTLEEIRGTITLVGPDNKEYIVSNISEFARKYNLDQGHLSKIINKQRKTHKGWKLKL